MLAAGKQGARGWWLALLLAGLLAACGGGPSLPALTAGQTVLAFGDSLTFGTGATPETSYPAQLQALIGQPVVRSGVPGETSAEAVQRLPGVLDDTKPALLILCTGGNDFLQRKPEAETIANLRLLLNEARQRRIPVLLVAVPRLSFKDTVPDFYAQLAQEYQIPLAEDAVVDVLKQRALKADPVHPNAAGYRQMAEAIAQSLKSAGAVR